MNLDSTPSVLGHSSEPESHDNDDSFDVVDIDEVPSPSSVEQEVNDLKIMFHGSKNKYQLGEDIEIKFYCFNNAYQMEDGDRVGIMPMDKMPFVSQKVEKSIPASCVDIISNDLIEENQITAKQLEFRVEEIPAEFSDERYFQFCYLNNQGQVIGRSNPFQFLSVRKESSAGDDSVQQSSVMDIEIEKPASDEVHMERQEDDDFIVVSLSLF